jgi:hypothetical protein
VKYKLHINITSLISLLIIPGLLNTVSASDLIIDDRTSGTYRSNLGTEWQLITDQVMGGISKGELILDNYNNRNCLRMRGDVTTENNGGFVQIALPLSEQDDFDATDYSGVELEVAGNNEAYNIHIRTSGLWFPWKSYRFTFQATTGWKTLRFPFAEIKPYKTNKRFQQHRLMRIGLVGIGRDFQADLCVASVKLYKE